MQAAQHSTRGTGAFVFALPRLLSLDAAAGPEGQGRERGDERKENEGNGRSIAKVVFHKGLIVNDVGCQICLCPRSALGEHHHGDIGLKIGDQRGDDDEHHSGPQQGQGEKGEALCRGGAVHLRGLIAIGRQRIQAAQKNHHRIAEILPDGQKQNGAHGVARIEKPVDFGSQNLIDQAKLRIIHEFPHKGHRHHRGDGGQVIQRAVQ